MVIKLVVYYFTVHLMSLKIKWLIKTLLLTLMLSTILKLRIRQILMLQPFYPIVIIWCLATNTDHLHLI